MRAKVCSIPYARRKRAELRLEFCGEELAELGDLWSNDRGAVSLEWISRKILLMVRFGLVPDLSSSNFRHDRIDRKPLFCDDSDHLVGNLFLLRPMMENCRWSRIVPLSIGGCRIVDDKQHFKQLAIVDDGGIERDTDRFCMTSPATAHGLICWMVYLPPMYPTRPLPHLSSDHKLLRDTKSNRQLQLLQPALEMFVAWCRSLIILRILIPCAMKPQIIL